jgi:hypothetical protein
MNEQTNGSVHRPERRQKNLLLPLQKISGRHLRIQLAAVLLLTRQGHIFNSLHDIQR